MIQLARRTLSSRGREGAGQKGVIIIGMEIPRLFGLVILAADVWEIINIFQSAVSTGTKVAWIVGVLAFPGGGLFAGPRENKWRQPAADHFFRFFTGGEYFSPPISTVRAMRVPWPGEELICS